jgi:hypothetical protein
MHLKSTLTGSREKKYRMGSIIIQADYEFAVSRMEEVKKENRLNR